MPPANCIAPTRRLAEWSSTVSSDGLPAEALTKSAQGILDTVGVGLAGLDHDASRRMAGVVEDLAGRPQATLLGSTERTSTALAALHNAYVSHVLDFDDTHFDAIVHVNAPVTAAALAVAEHEGASGLQLLTAHAVGLEVTSRVAIAAGAQQAHGWHLTGTAGAMGAAMAAARLMGLTPDQTTFALGIASTLSSGLRGHRGTMTKAMNPAHAAQNGVLAAVAARRGLTSSTTILEQPGDGYFLTHGAPEAPGLADDLGDRLRMLDWDPKPYPCGVVIHPAVDAALALLDQGVRAADIATVELLVNPLALSITGNAAPSDGLQSKFSVFHATATALLTGSLLPAHFEDDWVGRTDVVDLRSRITGTSLDDTPRDEAEVVVVLNDGTRLSARTKARGTRERRMTAAEVEHKFVLLTTPLLGADGASAVVDQVRGLPEADSVAPLLRACVVVQR